MDVANHTLLAQLFLRAQEVPEKIIIKYQQNKYTKTYTYQDFYRAVKNIAEILITLGINKKDSIALILENKPYWGMIYFGILMVGAIVVPLDPKATNEDVNYCINDACVKLIITEKQFEERLSILNTKIITIEQIIKSKIFSTKNEKKISSSNIESDIAAIVYTSGTTGRPKGVILSHDNFYQNYLGIYELNILSKGQQNFLSILPLHHTFSFMVTFLIPIFSKNTITYIDKIDSQSIISACQKNKVTILAAVPQFFELLTQNFKNEINKINIFARSFLFILIYSCYQIRKFSKINLNKLFLYKIHKKFGKNFKYFICGGAKINIQSEIYLYKLGFTLLQGYGLTESAPILTINSPKNFKFGSAGQPIKNVKIKLHEKNINGVGEVLAQGPNIMRGYLHLPQETKDVIKNNWFYTGDFGYIDNNNFLFITGRKKEIIKLSNGKNIDPFEIENYFNNIKIIKEIAITATKVNNNEVLCAIILPNFNYLKKIHISNIEDKVKLEVEHVNKNLASYKRIMHVQITNKELPKTRLGKLQRHLLLYYLDTKKKSAKKINYTNEELQIITTKLYQYLITTIRNKNCHLDNVNLHDNLELDLQLSSLDKVELYAKIESELKIKILAYKLKEVFSIFDLYNVLKNNEKISTKFLHLTHDKFSENIWHKIILKPLPKKIKKSIELHPNLINRYAAMIFSHIDKFFLKLLHNLKIYGIENLPVKSSLILCANHTSFLDGLIIFASLPKSLQNNIFFFGYAPYFNAPIIKNFIRAAKIIPLDAGTQLINAMQAASFVLKHNKIICIFPEGQRSIDGKLQEFKPGVGILVKELNVPIVPIYISGAFNAWPRNQKMPHPFPIKIIFGKKYYLSDLISDINTKDAYSVIAQNIKNKILEIQQENIT